LMMVELHGATQDGKNAFMNAVPYIDQS
jgi:hypothetical protein